MEQRALVAFVLSLIVITIWTVWSGQKSQEHKKEAIQQTEIAKSPEKVQQEPQVQEKKTPIEIPKFEEKSEKGSFKEEFITIDTPLMYVTLSNKGGVLTSCKLKKYKESIDQNADLIELIPEVQTDERFLDVVLGNELDEVIKNNRYRFDDKGFVLENGKGLKSIHAQSELGSDITIRKTWTFHEDSYVIEHEVEILDKENRSITDRLGILMYDLVGHDKSRWVGFRGPVILTKKDLDEVKKISKYEEPKDEVIWAGFASKYFLSAIEPVDVENKKILLKENDDTYREMIIEQSLKERDQTKFKYIMYFGPKALSELKKAGNGFGKALNFGFFDIIARPLLIALKFIYKFTKNYGIGIIILTILIKLIFWPLTHKSYSSMKEMQRIQPRIKQVREQFKNDKEQLNREMMLLYKTHKVNPFGGCLPMVLQIPVFFALYKTLMDSIELRHAPFIFWLKDLSGPDYLFNFPQGINFFGIEGIGPLPLIMGVSMIIQQKMTPTMGDPMQAKLMMLMPIFFTFLFISFPSGLVLYWLMNNLLSIIQQVYIQSKLE